MVWAAFDERISRHLMRAIAVGHKSQKSRRPALLPTTRSAESSQPSRALTLVFRGSVLLGMLITLFVIAGLVHEERHGVPHPAHERLQKSVQRRLRASV